MSLIFRPMTREDVPVVTEIEKSLFSDPWSERMFLADIKNEKISHAYVLLKEDTLIGYIVCLLVAGELHITNVAVVPTQQRAGYGSYLLVQLFEHHPLYDVAYLEVREDNLAAIKLYEKFGFLPMYKRRNYYPGGKDAVVMIKFPAPKKGEK